MTTINSSNQSFPNNSIELWPTHNWRIGVGSIPITSTGTDSVYLGDGIAPSATTPSSVQAIGYHAANAGTSIGFFVAIGTSSAAAETNASTNSVTVGYQCSKSSTTFNQAVGVGSGCAVSAAADNVFVGYQAAQAYTGANCVAIGSGSFSGASATGALNIIFGTNSFISGTTSAANVVFGYNSLANVTTGGDHACLGNQTGNNYTGSESNNILLGNGVSGTTGESNVMRLGSPSNITSSYLAGVTGVTVTNQVMSVFNSSTGQFGQVTGTVKLPGGVATVPVASATATAAFVTTLTAGSGAQNSTGYDLMCNITVVVTAASGATLTYGVGTVGAPTENTIIQNFSVPGIFTFSAYVPNTYYLVYDYTGTITIGSVTVQSCAI